MGTQYWVEMNEKGYPSFHQKKMIKIDKNWHSFKNPKDPKEKKDPEKNSVESLKQKGSFLKTKQKLASDLWGKELR